MNKYYNLKNLLKENALYNVIIGERSNGKTYATLEYAIKNILKRVGKLQLLEGGKKILQGKEVVNYLLQLFKII